MTDTILLVGALSGVLLLIIGILLVRAKREDERPVSANIALTQPQTAETKRCMWCQSEIPASAIVCIHCGRDIRRSLVKAQLLTQIGGLFLILFILFNLVLFFMGGGAGLF